MNCADLKIHRGENDTANDAESHFAKSKAGFVAVIGRPNAGKSTLINLLVGDTVSVVTNLAQTTRHSIQGIYTDKRGQLVFIDTPGINKSNTKFGVELNFIAKKTFNNKDIDLIIYIVDGSKYFKKESEIILEMLSQVKAPIMVLINKNDKETKFTEEDKSTLSQKINPKLMLRTSATDESNKEQLLNVIFDFMPEHELFYPADQISTANMRFLTAELLREQVIINTKDEIPHATAIRIDKYKEKEGQTYIEAAIVVEKKSQKGILIGKDGNIIKNIKHFTKRKLKEFIYGKIVLELNVIIRKNWRDNPHFSKVFSGDSAEFF